VYLAANRPNPFNPATRIEFGLGTAGSVFLEIFDPCGRRVCRLLAGEVLEAGVHVRDWNGRDDAGLPMASGVYLCRLETGGRIQSRSMMLLR
jgi:hypothetical protein